MRQQPAGTGTSAVRDAAQDFAPAKDCSAIDVGNVGNAHTNSFTNMDTNDTANLPA